MFQAKVIFFGIQVLIFTSSVKYEGLSRKKVKILFLYFEVYEGIKIHFRNLRKPVEYMTKQ